MAGNTAQAGSHHIDKQKLLQALTGRFDAGELGTLCFNLGLAYDELAGETREEKARELIAYLERRARLPELLAQGRRLRPDVPWDDIEFSREPSDPCREVGDLDLTREVLFVDRERELQQLAIERLRASRSPMCCSARRPAMARATSCIT